MMKRTGIFSLSWPLPITALAGIALTAGAFAVFGQTKSAPPQVQSAAPTIRLSGSTGERFTLVHSADAGWRLHAGWDGEDSNAPRSTKAVLTAADAQQPVDERPALERPLTVFVDGPTGFTFMYVFDEGWKFVGRVADRAR